MMYKTIAAILIATGAWVLADPVKTTNDRPPVATATSMPVLALIGTIIRVDKKQSLASVRLGDSGYTGEYRVDNNIKSRALVLNIERQRLTYKNLTNGQVEYISLGAYDPAHAVNRAKMDSPGREKEFQVRRSQVDQVLKNLNTFLQQAKAVPATAPDGSVHGFRLDWIAEGSLYSQLGLKEGDVLKSVNGVELDSLTAAIHVFEQFQNSSMIRLSTGRAGKTLDLTYLIRE